jgi:urease accessory protein
MSRASLYRLMTWLSPTFPVGSFTHSSGLEWAVAEGLIRNRRELEDWILELLAMGTARNDAVLFVRAWRFSEAGDHPSLIALAELAAALLSSRERRLESTAQGAAFRRIASNVAGCTAFNILTAIPDQDLCYPIAVAVLAEGHGIELGAALTAYLHAVVGNLVSAAQRLIPLGQTDGQIALAALEPEVHHLVDSAMALPDADPIEQLGSATLMADFATMAHETQYTRLFRT